MKGNFKTWIIEFLESLDYKGSQFCRLHTLFLMQLIRVCLHIIDHVIVVYFGCQLCQSVGAMRAYDKYTYLLRGGFLFISLTTNRSVLAMSLTTLDL